MGPDSIELLLEREMGVEWPSVDSLHMVNIGINWHAFPNLIVLANVTFSLGFRLRPDGYDPDSCINETFALEHYPQGQESETKWG